MGGKRKWTIRSLFYAVKKSTSVRQVLKKLKLKEAGGNYSQIKKCISDNNISTAHFKNTPWNKGLKGFGKFYIPLERILVVNSSYQSYKLKKRLFKENLKSPSCEECGWAKISEDGRLPLELDHINGTRTDNRLMNLRILCPNCHSLKNTHRGLNRKKKPEWRNW